VPGGHNPTSFARNVRHDRERRLRAGMTPDAIVGGEGARRNFGYRLRSGAHREIRSDRSELNESFRGVDDR
jgi:hypothetical protein